MEKISIEQLFIYYQEKDMQEIAGYIGHDTMHPIARYFNSLDTNHHVICKKQNNITIRVYGENRAFLKEVIPPAWLVDLIQMINKIPSRQVTVMQMLQVLSNARDLQ